MPKTRRFLNPARLLLVLLCAATGCALLAPLGWPFELFAHFRVQYAAAALLLALLFTVMQRPGPAAVAAALALFHATPLMRSALAHDPVADCNGPAVTVVTANVRYRNGDRQAFVDWLARNPADVVVVQELTSAWAEQLGGLVDYPYGQLLVREDPYGIAVLSRRPPGSVRPADFAGDGLPSLVAQLEIGGRTLMILGLHTHWPLLPRLARARDESLHRVAKLIRDEGLPAVALGDLNLTPYSPVYARFLGEAGLRDAMDGHGWKPTWQAGFWPLALRIDHVLVSPGLCVEHAEVGPDIGSDHRPVIARLRLPAATPP